MTFVIVGTIIRSEKGILIVEDKNTGDLFEIIPSDDETLELPVGTTGLYVGVFSNKEYKAKWVEPRRLLEPLYNEDLLEVSGRFVMDIVGDPFPEIYTTLTEEDDSQPQ